MKILVTGGTGFIGSYMANHLYKNGHDVTICDNSSIGTTGFGFDFKKRGSLFLNPQIGI